MVERTDLLMNGLCMDGRVDGLAGGRTNVWRDGHWTVG
jgi:hypothetical protein